MTEGHDMYEDESAPMPLQRNSHAPKRFWRFDPTISTGTLVLFGEILLGGIFLYGTWVAERERTTMELAQVKKDAIEQRSTAKEGIAALVTKVDQMQATLNTLAVDVAVVKARKETP